MPAPGTLTVWWGDLQRAHNESNSDGRGNRANGGSLEGGGRTASHPSPFALPPSPSSQCCTSDYKAKWFEKAQVCLEGLAERSGSELSRPTHAPASVHTSTGMDPFSSLPTGSLGAVHSQPAHPRLPHLGLFSAPQASF